MNRNFSIQPECEADTLIVENLGFKNPGHQRGISEVFKNFKDEKLKSRILVGIVDRDKRLPSDMIHFVETQRVESLFYLCSKLNPRHFLINHPPLENWIYEEVASSVDVPPAGFGFSSKAYFKEVAKSRDVHQHRQFRQFINELKVKQAPGFQALEKWLNGVIKDVY